MNGYGYNSMGMYSGYGQNSMMGGGGYNNMNMMQNQQQQQQVGPNGEPLDPEMQQQQSLADHLRTAVSGLSAITGISYGGAIIFKTFMKLFKLVKMLFAGRSKNAAQVLEQAWRSTPANSRARTILKYAILGVTLMAQAALYMFIKRKRTVIQQIDSESSQIAEEAKMSAMDEMWDQEISVDDFKVDTLDTIEELTDDADGVSELFWCSTDSESEPIEIKRKDYAKHSLSWANTYNKYSEEGWPRSQLYN